MKLTIILNRLSKRNVLYSSILTILLPSAFFTLMSLFSPTTGPNPLPLQTARVGTVSGSFSVNSNGQAAYSIPIDIPQGAGGMHPQLALSYNSDGGNGTMGVGWNLVGLSSITRGGKTKAVDGRSSVVMYNDNDRFYIDGQEMVVQNRGTYGAANSIYKTAIESHTNIVAEGNQGTGKGPSSFKTYTAGQITEYGNTTNAKVHAVGNVAFRTWAVNKVTDLNGNYMTVDYVQSATTGQYYPKVINYTGNVAAGLNNGSRRVVFNYRTRTDITNQYMGGSIITTDSLLSSISVYIRGEMVMQYNLNYTTSGGIGDNRLTSVQQCDGDGVCKPSTIFEWESTSSTYSQLGSEFALPRAMYEINDTISKKVGTFADINGDGYTDYLIAQRRFTRRRFTRFSIVYYNSYCSIYLGSATGFHKASYDLPGLLNYSAPGQYSSRPAGVLNDFNNDGYLDYVKGTYETTQPNPAGNHITAQNDTIYFGSATGFIKSTTTLPGPMFYVNPTRDNYQYVPAGVLNDFNGDGLLDYVNGAYWDNNAHDTRIYIGEISNGQFHFRSSLGTLPGPIHYNKFQEFKSVTRGAIRDINSDGYPDYVSAYNYLSTTGFVTGPNKIYLGGPQAVFTLSAITLPGILDYNWFAGWQSRKQGILRDFNGDGLTDFSPANLLFTAGLNRWTPPDYVPHLDISFFTGTGFTTIPRGTTVEKVPAAVYYLNNGGVDFLTYGEFTDLNNDGIPDYCSYLKFFSTPRNIGVYGTRGNGFVNQNNSLLSAGSYQHIALNFSGKWTQEQTGTFTDITGDGIPDYIMSYESGVAFNRRTHSANYQGPKQLPKRIVTITNGLQNKTSITYTPLTDNTVYTKGTTSQTGVKDVQNASYVVSRYVNTPNIINTINTYNYAVDLKYGGKRTNPTYGALGFAWKQETTANKTTKIFMNQAYPLIGSVDSVHVYEGSTLTSKKITEYRVSILSGNTNTYTILSDKQKAYDYDQSQLVNYTKVLTVYDAHANPQSVSAYSGPSPTNLTDSVFDHTQYSYHIFNNYMNLDLPLATKKTKSSSVNFSSWDATNDLIWSRSWYNIADSTANLLRSELYNNTKNSWLGTTFNYDEIGNTIKKIGNRQDTSIFVYDSYYRTFLYQTMTPKNEQGERLGATYIHNPLNGAVTYSIDAVGLVSKTNYDGFGRPISHYGSNPLTTSTSDIIQLDSIIYAKGANNIGLEVTSLQRCDWNNDTISKWYWDKAKSDALGRTIVNQSKSAEGQVIETRKEFNNTIPGQLMRTSTPRNTSSLGAHGRSTSSLGAHGRSTNWSTTYNYYLNGEIREIIHNGDPVSYTHNKVLRSTTQQTSLGATTTYTNIRGNVTLRIDPNGDSTRFYYDELGRITRSINPIGATNTTTYNSLNQVLTIENEDAGTTSFQYTNGLVTGKLQRRGGSSTVQQVESYSFDKLGRMISKKQNALNSTTVESEDKFYYDGIHTMGRLDSVARTSTTYSTPTSSSSYQKGVPLNNYGTYKYKYGYDDYGNVTIKKVTIPSASNWYSNNLGTNLTIQGLPNANEHTFITLKQYNARGQVTKETLPDSTDLYHYYFANGTLKNVFIEDDNLNSRARTTLLTYSNINALGQPENINYGNGVAASYTYDPTTQKVEEHTIKKGSETLLDNKYSWGLYGLLRSINDVRYGLTSLTSETQRFTYNNMGWLTSAHSPPGNYGHIGYSYHKGGSLASMNTKTFAHTTGNRVASASITNSNTYDPNGGVSQFSSKNPMGALSTSQLISTFNADNSLRDVQAVSTVGGTTKNIRSTIYYDYSGERLAQFNGVYNGSQELITGSDFQFYVSESVTIQGSATANNTIGNMVINKYAYGPTGKTVMIQTPVSDISLLTHAANTYRPTAGYNSTSQSSIIPVGVPLTKNPNNGGGWNFRLIQQLALTTLGAICLIWLLIAVISITRKTIIRQSEGKKWVALLNPIATTSVIFMLLFAFPQNSYATPPTTSNSTNLHYFHHDHIGSAHIVTDDAGNEVSRINYTPYGNIAKQTGSLNISPSFTGQELTKNLNLYYFNSRWYQPLNGNFMSADSELGTSFNAPMALNRYAYGGSNPIKYIDPSGHGFFAALAGAVIGAVAGAVMATIEGKTGKEFWLEVGLGAATGAVAGLLGPAAGQIVARAGLKFGARLAMRAGARAGGKAIARSARLATLTEGVVGSGSTTVGDATGREIAQAAGVGGGSQSAGAMAIGFFSGVAGGYVASGLGILAKKAGGALASGGKSAFRKFKPSNRIHPNGVPNKPITLDPMHFSPRTPYQSARGDFYSQIHSNLSQRENGVYAGNTSGPSINYFTDFSEQLFGALAGTSAEISIASGAAPKLAFLLNKIQIP